ncbi:MAG: TolC family protein [Opitutaceae bacterium]|nr:TolC family protein [Opitutaceae bacterium]
MPSPLPRLFPLLQLTLLVAFSLGLGRAAETSAARPGTLTLQECIGRALQHNFDLQIQGFSTSNAVQTLVGSQSDYDPSFTLSASKSASRADVPSTQLVGTESDNFSTRIGVTQKIATGASLNLSSSLDRSATNNPYATLNPAYNADMALSVRQPLLKNAGAAVNRAAIRRAELGVDIANLNYKSRLLQVVRDTEGAYYDLVFAREQLKVRRHSLALAEKLYDENLARKNTGVATDLDVLQAEVGVASARNNVLLAEQSARDAQDRLLNLIGQFQFDDNVGEVGMPDFNGIHVDFAASYKLARDNQPDYIATENSIRQYEIDVAAARRNRLPSLDLGGALGYNARDNSAHDAFNRVPNGDGYSWQVDLSLTVPWGMRGDKARYFTARNNLMREQTRLRQLEQNIMVQVRAAVRSVETNLESVAISAQGTSLSERQYELERARFDAGLSTSRRVLEAQDDLERARVAELQARVNLRKAISELHRLEGSSLETYDIAVAEPVSAVNG